MFFLAVIVTTGFFVGNVDGSQQAGQFCQLISQSERQILIQNCYQIRAQIAEYFCGLGGAHGGGLGSSSGFKNAVKQEITNYLHSIRTPTALQLLNEFQANGFRDFVS